MTVTGVRWAESVARNKQQGIITALDVKEIEKESLEWQATKNKGMILKNDNADKRQIYEVCQVAREALVNPIIDWTDAEVWEFIRAENIPYCGLYDEGFHRLGCIGCPMARQHGRERQFARWPKYKNLYLLAFQKMIEERKERGLKTKGWYDAEDVYRWWMEYDELPGQIDVLEDYDL